MNRDNIKDFSGTLAGEKLKDLMDKDRKEFKASVASKILEMEAKLRVFQEELRELKRMVEKSG